ncbi:MAG: hypothetical protein HC849_06875 [Oscillatoriales cyanobacterium RU_3_3]|nr:hypothetical protein [Oscillatoriales cyanobacterium RU_3_3]
MWNPHAATWRNECGISSLRQGEAFGLIYYNFDAKTVAQMLRPYENLDMVSF